MNFLRTLDLYKAIVLLSLVVLPVGGWYVTSLDETIALSKKSIEAARRPGGLLEQIGNLQHKVEVVVQNKRSTSDSIKEPRTYFEGQILAVGAGLKTSDFQPQPAKEETSNLGKQHVADFVVDVTWRKEMVQKLEFISAVLFNCESGARNNDQVQQSVWRLRELTLVNATDERLTTSFSTPPPSLEDRWRIATMKFARREPKKGK